MHRRFLSIPIVSFLLLVLMGFKHNFYVGLCMIDHNPITKSLEVDQRLFTNDLEMAIKAAYKVNLQLNTEKEFAKADSILNLYFSENLRIWTDADVQIWNWLGHDGDVDATHCYLEIKNAIDYKKLKVSNTLLMEQFEGQTQMLKLKWPTKKVSFYLKKGSSDAVYINR